MSTGKCQNYDPRRQKILNFTLDRLKKPILGQGLQNFGLKKPIFGQGNREIWLSKSQFFGQSFGGASRGLVTVRHFEDTQRVKFCQ